MQQPKATSKASREAYIVVLPFPWHGGHWTTKDEELTLLPQEAKGLLNSGRIKKKAATTATTKSK